MIATPARGRQQVRAQMRGKGLQDWMRPALSLHGLGQMWKRRIPAAHVSKGDIKGTKGTQRGHKETNITLKVSMWIIKMKKISLKKKSRNSMSKFL